MDFTLVKDKIACYYGACYCRHKDLTNITSSNYRLALYVNT